jgi:hypothetical protein
LERSAGPKSFLWNILDAADLTFFDDPGSSLPGSFRALAIGRTLQNIGTIPVFYRLCVVGRGGTATFARLAFVKSAALVTNPE